MRHPAVPRLVIEVPIDTKGLDPVEGPGRGDPAPGEPSNCRAAAC